MERKAAAHGSGSIITSQGISVVGAYAFSSVDSLSWSFGAWRREMTAMGQDETCYMGFSNAPEVERLELTVL